MATGPDTYTQTTTNDLTSEDFEILAEVWPAAFIAAGKLKVQIVDGDQPENSSMLDESLLDLVEMHKRGDY